MAGPFKNKNIFLTGGSGLVGERILDALLLEGAIVHYCGRSESVNTNKSQSVYYKCDLNSSESIESLLKEISQKKILFDGFVHCAWSRPSQKDLKNQEGYFLESVQNNSQALYMLSNFFAKNMAQNDKSSMVFIGSIYGVVAPDFSIYSGTNMGTEQDYQFLKFGINGLSKYLSSLYGHKGLRSNVVILGGIENNQPKRFIDAYSKKTCIARMARPDETVGPVLFLLSEDSSYVTGSELTVDGGYTAR